MTLYCLLLCGLILWGVDIMPERKPQRWVRSAWMDPA